MNIERITLKESMSKNIQAIMPLEEEKLYFERNLQSFLKHLNARPNESEEFQKNLLKELLQKCLPENFINTFGRTDLAIYNGASPESSVGVLIETKSLSNKSEMMSKENYNTKAFQEIIHYYLNERLLHNNIELKKCIITNGLEWFIIEAKEIEKHFVGNKDLIDLYYKWGNNQLSNTTTEFLYKEVIAPAITSSLKKGLKITDFNFKDVLKKDSTKKIKKSNLTNLYRFFTAENLLNKEVFADSNKLNKNFYDELLYLMGLEEVQINNKIIIQRLPKNRRQIGSFIENTIDRLKINDVAEEVLYENAMQLTVIWINRILFLKLLESQLVTFNDEEKYKVLTEELLPTFDDIYYLFFGVLAQKVHKRTHEMNEKFPYVPYLNSSLFEETELEMSENGIAIDRLREHDIQLYSKTVLQDKNGKRKTGKIEFLTYLFDFLSVYDFSGSIKHNNKNKNTLINASVLGLVFEKINGYKEGSYFTPGRITMYMSRDIVRKAVVNKINEAKDWECKNVYEIEFKITTLKEAKEISSIIDTLKICDPAVGSGHFLVSVLNEIIAIKSELKILIDTEGRSMNEIRCTVVNDELIIQDYNGENFIYNRKNNDSKRIQKAIFHEKRKLIENCLFGVDINPNSANICRLRLWIELLKHSYYYLDEESNSEQLITLPNIDINIKVGNSLIHKFGVDEGLDKRSPELKDYIKLVSEYKRMNDKKKKQELIKQIFEIKQKFFSSIETPEIRKVRRLTRNLKKVGQISLFATIDEKKTQRNEIVKINKKLKEANVELEYSRQNPLFRKGLEWRMEFPEILNNKGDFEGFDIVIANPPYLYSTDEAFTTAEKSYFEKEYPLSRYQANTFGLFLELAFKILKNNGYSSMIIPNTFLTIAQYNMLRKHILKNTGDVFIINSYDKIFEDASVDNCIISFKTSKSNLVTLAEHKNKEVNIVKKIHPEELLKHDIINISAFKGLENNRSDKIMEKIKLNSLPIHNNYGDVKDGLKAYERGKGKPKQPEDKNEFDKFKKAKTYFSKIREDETYRKFLNGLDVNRYKLNWSGNYLKYGDNLAAKRSSEIFKGDRVLIKRIPARSEYSFLAIRTDDEYIHEQSIETIGKLKVPSEYLLGVLNSKVEAYWGIHKYDFLQRRTFPQLRLYQIKELPIPYASKEEQSFLIRLVKNQINLHSILEPTSDEMEKMKELDIEIDEYVMELYKLNDEEKIIIRNFSIE